VRGRIPPPILQMDRSHSTRFKITSAARAALVAVLLGVFLSGILPLAPVAAGSLCALECCAGKAPHASGSCMKGSCPISLLAARLHKHDVIADKAERLCGLPRTLKTTSFTRRQASSPGASDRVSSFALERPCQADCGSCASGSANSHRPRNSAAVTGDSRPRPPTITQLPAFGFRPALTLRTLCRQGAPRGPPTAGF
jgi:hypothetical protein